MHKRKECRHTDSAKYRSAEGKTATAAAASATFATGPVWYAEGSYEIFKCSEKG